MKYNLNFVDYFKKNYLVDIPDTILADKRTFLKNVREFYKTFVKGNILETNSKTAEMCKLVENSSRDVQIAFANELDL